MVGQGAGNSGRDGKRGRGCHGESPGERIRESKVLHKVTIIRLCLKCNLPKFNKSMRSLQNNEAAASKKILVLIDL